MIRQSVHQPQNTTTELSKPHDTLNPKQSLFCQYYLESKGNATDSYMKAYEVENYDTAKTNASRMLTKFSK